MKKIIVILFIMVGVITNTFAKRPSLTDVLYMVGNPWIEGTVNGKIYECRIADFDGVLVKLEIIGVGKIEFRPKLEREYLFVNLYKSKSDAKHNRNNICKYNPILSFVRHFNEGELIADYYVTVKDYKVVTTPRPKQQPKKIEPIIKLIKN